MSDTPLRYLFRRAIALFIDWALAALLTTALIFPIINGNSDNIRFSGIPISLSKCWEPTVAPQELHDLIAPSPIDKLTICEEKPFGIRNGLTAELVFDLQESRNGAVTTRSFKSRSTAIDDNGLPITPFYPQGILIFITLLFGSAYWQTKTSGFTPGKRFMGLRVTPNTFPTALRREFWRWIPLLVMEVVILTLAYIPLTFLMANFTGFIAVAGAMGLLLVWYYLWPIIRWKGAMRHDRISGTLVRRSK